MVVAASEAWWRRNPSLQDSSTQAREGYPSKARKSYPLAPPRLGCHSSTQYRYSDEIPTPRVHVAVATGNVFWAHAALPRVTSGGTTGLSGPVIGSCSQGTQRVLTSTTPTRAMIHCFVLKASPTSLCNGSWHRLKRRLQEWACMVAGVCLMLARLGGNALGAYSVDSHDLTLLGGEVGVMTFPFVPPRQCCRSDAHLCKRDHMYLLACTSSASAKTLQDFHCLMSRNLIA